MSLGYRTPLLPAAFACATLLALAWPQSASAAWPPFGRAVSRASGDQVSVAITEDGADGAILTWVDRRDITAVNIYAGHVLASGEVDAAWPVDGRALRADPLALGDEPADPAFPEIVSDGAGGAIVVWQDGRSAATGIDVYAQHVLASGGLDPAWPPNGAALCVVGGAQAIPSVAPDGAGGAIAAWIDGRDAGTGNAVDVYAQHVLASGLVDPQWPVNGVAVSVAAGPQVAPTVVGDGAGGVIVTWFDGRSAATGDDIYAQRVLASGVVDPAWPVNGRALCTAPGSQLEPKIVSDVAHGAVVTWFDQRTVVSHVYAHHVLATGAVDPAWPADGRALTDRTSSEENPSLVPDGSGGAVVVWQSPGNGFIDIYAHHVTGAGVADPTWPVGGALVHRSPMGADPEIAEDGAGGVVVAWHEGAGIAARHAFADGTFDPAYPDTGRTITLLPTLGPAGLVATSAGGAIVGWSDARSSDTGLDVYAMQILDATPQAIYLTVFTAERRGQRAMVHWAVSQPLDHAGFRVWRQESGLDRICLSQPLLSGQEVYDFVDWTPPSGRADYWLQEVTTDGSENWYGPAHLETAAAPAALRLYPSAPNPFNPATTIRFDLPQPGQVRLSIYDVGGRLIRELVNDAYPVGSHTAAWDGRDAAGRAMASGAYFARLQAGGKLQTVRMSLVR